MPTMDERRLKIQKIKSLPGILEATLEGLSEAQLDTPYRDGGWTVRQVVHHLCDAHMNAFLRCKWIVVEDQPAMKTYNQDDWAVTPEYRLNIHGAVALLRGLHERWAFLLDSLTEEQWSRSGKHPERGDVSLDSMLETYSFHGEKHCAHIMGLREKMDW
ncbi:MAG: putative metal-dependent hydrolase [Bacteroidetes bacterium]|nr:putative metal-dependent hydrolase [Bacteroidota bacterium]